MINKLIKLASHLDEKGFKKEADYLDLIIKESAEELKVQQPTSDISQISMYNQDQIEILTRHIVELNKKITQLEKDVMIMQDTLIMNNIKSK